MDPPAAAILGRVLTAGSGWKDVDGGWKGQRKFALCAFYDRWRHSPRSPYSENGIAMALTAFSLCDG